MKDPLPHPRRRSPSKLVQPLKVAQPIEVSESGRKGVTVRSAVQPSKAPDEPPSVRWLKVVREEDRTTLVSAVQVRKAAGPMVVSVSGSRTEVRSVRPLKALPPIATMVYSA